VGGERFAAADDVQPSGGRQLLGLFRNEADDVGADGEGRGFHLGGGGHLDGELRLDRLPQHPEVALVDVATVAAQMGGDPGRAGLLGDQGGQDGLGFGRPPGLAQAGEMIDVEGQLHEELLPEKILPSGAFRLYPKGIVRRRAGRGLRPRSFCGSRP